MSASVPRLWLVRHARVQLASGLCYGSSDVLADAQHTQAVAQELSNRLSGLGVEGLPVQVSPLQRCVQLVQALKQLRPSLSWQTSAALREMDFGSWEGRPWSAIVRSEFDAWMADFSQARPGGDGENVAELMARVAQAWDAWRDSGRDALWITHAGVMRAAMLLARGQRQVEHAADWPDESLAFGQVLVLQAP